MAKKTIPQTGKALSAFLARVADNKLATDITVMDLQKIESAPAAYFVICTCDSEPQLKAVVDSVDEACIKVGIKKANVNERNLAGIFGMEQDFTAFAAFETC